MPSVEELVVQLVRMHVGAIFSEPFSRECTFDELGLDSLDFVEFCLDVEEEFGIDISSPEVDGLNSVGDLIQLVEKKLSA